jgi:hypothetical protein
MDRRRMTASLHPRSNSKTDHPAEALTGIVARFSRHKSLPKPIFAEFDGRIASLIKFEFTIWNSIPFMKQRILLLLLVLATALLAGPPPVNIITVTGDHKFLDGGGVYYASWSQTSAYNNVSVSIDLTAEDGSGTATVYLTTQVGTGTTAAQEIAHATVNTGGIGVNVFNGLTLPAGTYYLVADLTNGTSAWSSNTTGIVTAAAGVTENSDSNGSAAAAYPPASTGLTPSGLKDRGYSVSGNLAPVTVPVMSPSAMIVMTILLIGSALFIIRRRMA